MSTFEVDAYSAAIMGNEIKAGNYFKTREEAQVAAVYLKDCLRKFKENV